MYCCYLFSYGCLGKPLLYGIPSLYAFAFNWLFLVQMCANIVKMVYFRCMEATISIYIDTRRAKVGNQPEPKEEGMPKTLKKNAGLYPVKLRVYYNKVTRYYPTGYDLTVSDFEKSYKAEKPRGEYKDLKI